MRTQSKIYPYFLFQVNILILDNKFSHFLFTTDYMAVVETVDIVAKSLMLFITFLIIWSANSPAISSPFLVRILGAF